MGILSACFSLTLLIMKMIALAIISVISAATVTLIVASSRAEARILNDMYITNAAENAVECFQYAENSDELLALLKKYPHMPGLENIDVNEIAHLIFTTATELEFWVKSPRENSPIEALSSSQVMQEMYWQRTRGNVRTALEQTIEMLELYGLEPEMGHKECGGVKGQIDSSGHMTHINEQLTCDTFCKYDR